MTDVRDATDSLLADRPDLEDDLRYLLNIDAEHETWTFDDVPLDSGAFGELVSRGIVEKVSGKYRLANPAAVRGALEDEEITTESGERMFNLDFASDLPPRRVSLALVGALLLVAAFRLIAYQSVFREGHVVLLGNDPYYYRYWLFRLIEQGVGVFSLPEAAKVGEPLMLATLLMATKLLGETTSTASFVLAWYPVAAALVTSILVYVLTVKVTEDRRVGLAAVALLAVTPVHTYRTAIGFADHHAFDFVWLGVTAVAAVTLAEQAGSAPLVERLRNPETIWWISVLGTSIAAQVLAWNAGPILLIPLAVYSVVRTAAAVKEGESPVSDLPLVAGVALSALLTLGAHATLGWQRFYIVVTPLLLAIGLGVVIGIGEVARQRDLSGILTLGGLIAAGSAVFAVAYVVLPNFAMQFSQEVVRLSVGGADTNIAEMASIFSPRYGTIVGPFFFFGLSLYFALPFLAWGLFVGWRNNQADWVLVSSYGGFLFVLTLLQVRFAGHLALFVALFGGLAIVHLAAVTGVSERPAITSDSRSPTQPWQTDEYDEPAFSLPNRQTLVAVGLIFLLVGGLSAVMTPLRTNLLTVSDESYNAATFMEDYSEEKSWEYPQNYVLSEWGKNRMYNAIVSGQSRSYGYAQAYYDYLLHSTNSSEKYHQLNNRVGFVVIDKYDGFKNSSGEELYHKLHNWGSGTGHYRAVWASKDASKKVFTLVPGARVTGSADPNTSLLITQTVDVGTHTVTYKRQVTVNASGSYAVRVPYPGVYSLGNTSVTISEKAVTTGKTITVPESS